MRRSYVIVIGCVVVGLMMTLVLRTYSQRQPLDVGTFTFDAWTYERKEDIAFFLSAKEEYEHRYGQSSIHMMTGIPEGDYRSWLMNQMVMGREPDVFLVDDALLKLLISKEAIRPLEIAHVSETYRKGMLEGATWKDKLYGVPFLSQPRVMAVNRNLLDKIHIEKPANNWTWQDFHKICRAVAKSREIQQDGPVYGAVGYSWMDAFYSNGMPIEEELSEQLKSREFWNSVKYLYALNELNGSDRILTEEAFDEGKVVFMPMDYSDYMESVSLPGELERYVAIDWEILPMPAGPQGDNASIQKGYYWVISSRTHKEEEALAWINDIMSSRRFQEQIPTFFNGLPASREVQVEDIWAYILSRSIVGFATVSEAQQVDIITKQIEDILYEGKNLKASLIRARSKIKEEVK